jgi:hypothetical protein
MRALGFGQLSFVRVRIFGQFACGFPVSTSAPIVEDVAGDRHKRRTDHTHHSDDGSRVHVPRS